MSKQSERYQMLMTGTEVKYTYTLADGKDIMAYSDEYVEHLETLLAERDRLIKNLHADIDNIRTMENEIKAEMDAKLTAIREALPTDNDMFLKAKDSFNPVIFDDGARWVRTRIENILDK